MLGALACALALSSCGTSNAPRIDNKTAAEQIQHAYGVLFNFANKSVSTKVPVVEDGAALRTALGEGLTSPFAALATGAKVTHTTVLSPSACTDAAVRSPCAKVTYDILGSGGATLYSGSSGYAVYINGKWLVAKSTVCGLLATMYTMLGKKGAPPGC